MQLEVIHKKSGIDLLRKMVWHNPKIHSIKELQAGVVLDSNVPKTWTSRPTLDSVVLRTLNAAGIIEDIGKGKYRITEEGEKAINASRD